MIKYIKQAQAEGRHQQARHQAMVLLQNTYEIYDFKRLSLQQPGELPSPPPASDQSKPPKTRRGPKPPPKKPEEENVSYEIDWSN
jgi:hypothetical protein